MLDRSKLAQRNAYAHEYFVVVGDVSENTRIVERGEGLRETLLIGFWHAAVWKKCDSIL
jgi:hypothetical protein